MGPGWDTAWGALPTELVAACCVCGKGNSTLPPGGASRAPTTAPTALTVGGYVGCYAHISVERSSGHYVERSYVACTMAAKAQGRQLFGLHDPALVHGSEKAMCVPLSAADLVQSTRPGPREYRI